MFIYVYIIIYIYTIIYIYIFFLLINDSAIEHLIYFYISPSKEATLGGFWKAIESTYEGTQQRRNLKITQQKEHERTNWIITQLQILEIPAV